MKYLKDYPALIKLDINEYDIKLSLSNLDNHKEFQKVLYIISINKINIYCNNINYEKNKFNIYINSLCNSNNYASNNNKCKEINLSALIKNSYKYCKNIHNNNNNNNENNIDSYITDCKFIGNICVEIIKDKSTQNEKQKYKYEMIHSLSDLIINYNNDNIDKFDLLYLSYEGNINNQEYKYNNNNEVFIKDYISLLIFVIEVTSLLHYKIKSNIEELHYSFELLSWLVSISSCISVHNRAESINNVSSIIGKSHNESLIISDVILKECNNLLLTINNSIVVPHLENINNNAKEINNNCTNYTILFVNYLNMNSLSLDSICFSNDIFNNSLNNIFNSTNSATTRFIKKIANLSIQPKQFLSIYLLQQTLLNIMELKLNIVYKLNGGDNACYNINMFYIVSFITKIKPIYEGKSTILYLKIIISSCMSLITPTSLLNNNLNIHNNSSTEDGSLTTYSLNAVDVVIKMIQLLNIVIKDLLKSMSELLSDALFNNYELVESFIGLLDNNKNVNNDLNIKNQYNLSKLKFNNNYLLSLVTIKLLSTPLYCEATIDWLFNYINDDFSSAIITIVTSLSALFDLSNYHKDNSNINNNQINNLLSHGSINDVLIKFNKLFVKINENINSNNTIKKNKILIKKMQIIISHLINQSDIINYKTHSVERNLIIDNNNCFQCDTSIIEREFYNNYINNDSFSTIYRLSSSTRHLLMNLFSCCQNESFSLEAKKYLFYYKSSDNNGSVNILFNLLLNYEEYNYRFNNHMNNKIFHKLICTDYEINNFPDHSEKYIETITILQLELLLSRYGNEKMSLTNQYSYLSPDYILLTISMIHFVSSMVIINKTHFNKYNDSTYKFEKNLEIIAANGANVILPVLSNSFRFYLKKLLKIYLSNDELLLNQHDKEFNNSFSYVISCLKIGQLCLDFNSYVQLISYCFDNTCYGLFISILTMYSNEFQLYCISNILSLILTNLVDKYKLYRSNYTNCDNHQENLNISSSTLLLSCIPIVSIGNLLLIFKSDDIIHSDIYHNITNSIIEWSCIFEKEFSVCKDKEGNQKDTNKELEIDNNTHVLNLPNCVLYADSNDSSNNDNDIQMEFILLFDDVQNKVKNKKIETVDNKNKLSKFKLSYYKLIINKIESIPDSGYYSLFINISLIDTNVNYDMSNLVSNIVLLPSSLYFWGISVTSYRISNKINIRNLDNSSHNKVIAEHNFNNDIVNYKLNYYFQDFIYPIEFENNIGLIINSIIHLYSIDDIFITTLQEYQDSMDTSIGTISFSPSYIIHWGFVLSYLKFVYSNENINTSNVVNNKSIENCANKYWLLSSINKYIIKFYNIFNSYIQNIEQNNINLTEFYNESLIDIAHFSCNILNYVGIDMICKNYPCSKSNNNHNTVESNKNEVMFAFNCVTNILLTFVRLYIDNKSNDKILHEIKRKIDINLYLTLILELVVLYQDNDLSIDELLINEKEFTISLNNIILYLQILCYLDNSSLLFRTKICYSSHLYKNKYYDLIQSIQSLIEAVVLFTYQDVISKYYHNEYLLMQCNNSICCNKYANHVRPNMFNNSSDFPLQLVNPNDISRATCQVGDSVNLRTISQRNRDNLTNSIKKSKSLRSLSTFAFLSSTPSSPLFSSSTSSSYSDININRINSINKDINIEENESSNQDLVPRPDEIVNNEIISRKVLYSNNNNQIEKNIEKSSFLNDFTNSNAQSYVDEVKNSDDDNDDGDNDDGDNDKQLIKDNDLIDINRKENIEFDNYEEDFEINIKSKNNKRKNNNNTSNTNVDVSNKIKKGKKEKITNKKEIKNDIDNNNNNNNNNLIQDKSLTTTPATNSSSSYGWGGSEINKKFGSGFGF
jgi:hypothetical protein